MHVVIDASLAIRLLIPNRDQMHLRSHLHQWVTAGDSLAAPSLWLYEIVSALVRAVHFGQLSTNEARQATLLAYSLPIELVNPDIHLADMAFDWSLRLQRANAYDAYYLALAQELGCELWTVDRRLVNAAQQTWVRYALS